MKDFWTTHPLPVPTLEQQFRSMKTFQTPNSAPALRVVAWSRIIMTMMRYGSALQGGVRSGLGASATTSAHHPQHPGLHSHGLRAPLSNVHPLMRTMRSSPDSSGRRDQPISLSRNQENQNPQWRGSLFQEQTTTAEVWLIQTADLLVWVAVDTATPDFDTFMVREGEGEWTERPLAA